MKELITILAKDCIETVKWINQDESNPPTDYTDSTNVFESMLERVTKSAVKSFYCGERLAVALEKGLESRILSEMIKSIRKNHIYNSRTSDTVFAKYLNNVMYRQIISTFKKANDSKLTTANMIDEAIIQMSKSALDYKLTYFAGKEKCDDMIGIILKRMIKKECKEFYDRWIPLPYLISEDYEEVCIKYHIEDILYDAHVADLIYHDMLEDLLLDFCVKQRDTTMTIPEVCKPLIEEYTEKKIAKVYKKSKCYAYYIQEILLRDVIHECFTVEYQKIRQISLKLIDEMLSVNIKSLAWNTIAKTRISLKICENLDTNCLKTLKVNTFNEQKAKTVVYKNFIESVIVKEAIFHIISQEITEGLIDGLLDSKDNNGSPSRKKGMIRKITHNCISVLRIRDVMLNKMIENYILNWRCLPAYLHYKRIRSMSKDVFWEMVDDMSELKCYNENLTLNSITALGEDFIKYTIYDTCEETYHQCANIETVSESVGKYIINDVLEVEVFDCFRYADQKKQLIEKTAIPLLTKIERKMNFAIACNFITFPQIAYNFFTNEIILLCKQIYKKTRMAHFLKLEIAEQLFEEKVRNLIWIVYAQEAYEEECREVIKNKFDVKTRLLIKKSCVDNYFQCKIAYPLADKMENVVAKRTLGSAIMKDMTSLTVADTFIRNAERHFCKKFYVRQKIAVQICKNMLENELRSTTYHLLESRRYTMAVSRNIRDNFLFSISIDQSKAVLDEDKRIGVVSKSLYQDFVDEYTEQVILEFKVNRRIAFNRAISLEIYKHMINSFSRTIAINEYKKIIVRNYALLPIIKETITQTNEEIIRDSICSILILKEMIYEEIIDTAVKEIVSREVARETLKKVTNRVIPQIARNKVLEIKASREIAKLILYNMNLTLCCKTASQQIGDYIICERITNNIANDTFQDEIFEMGTDIYLNSTVGITMEKRVTAQFLREVCAEAIYDVTGNRTLMQYLEDQQRNPSPKQSFKQKSPASSQITPKEKSPKKQSTPSPKKLEEKKVIPTFKCINCEKFIPTSEIESHALTCIQHPKEQFEEIKEENFYSAQPAEESKGEITLEYINETMLLVHKNIERKIETLGLGLKPSITTYKIGEFLNKLKKILMSGLKNNWVLSYN